MTVVRVVREGKRAASPACGRLVHRVLACRFVVFRHVHRVLVRVGALGCVSPGHGPLLTEVGVSLFGAVRRR
eukprot:1632147-Pleurochrysis_carterae.AAC.1